MPKFITGNPVTGDSFIDRKKHLPLFKGYIDNHQNIMIKAPRRFGKTSLVKHLLEDNNEYNYIYIDINIVSNLKRLADKIIDSAYRLFNIDNFVYKAKHSVVELFKKAKEINIDVDDLYSLSIEFNQTKEIDEVEYFLHSLDVLNTIALKKKIQVHCVLDEFQDILKIANNSILDKTRSVIQHHTNITYIFLGSIESIMTKIFEHKSSAFFHFAKIIALPPLDIDELYRYTQDIFSKKDIDTTEILNYLQFLNGHPDYSMQFLQKVYITSLAYNIKSSTRAELNDFMIETIYDNKAYIDELINKAKAKKHHLEVLSAISKNKKAQLNGKSLYNIHISLEDMGLIRNVKQGKYEIVDIFLEFVLHIGGFEFLDSNGVEIEKKIKKLIGDVYE